MDSGIGLHFDLRHRFHGDGDALVGVEILLRRDVERHQLERQFAAVSTMGKITVPRPLMTRVPRNTIDDQRLMRAGFAEQPRKHADQKHQRQEPSAPHGNY